MFDVFHTGDRVRSVEKGPIMFVKGRDAQGRYVCAWYETNKGWTEKPFRAAELHRVGRRAPQSR